ncbi:MAG: hypothetical protein A3H98_10660 [Bacteroidetes bacterium RIFCSPLOWO2_02_FULL_36_8]|nr:MAG: hypothetical protein A3H98_10660 [Bacteroidetes bacterium RIFCSPLOWO2_02_FULL_36_8]OFY69760.1 MAG: hypothetical protein A3G23_11445 [Bacteroidetes bacterium RIFCSPLOWO2_12_FULL_37_12]
MKKKISTKFQCLLIFCMVLNTGIYSQQITYTVTSTYGEKLATILNNAIQEANTGAEVTVLFDAPGLVEITSELPEINNVNGKIFFCKAPGNLSKQGLIYSASLSDTIIKNGLVLNGTDIQIKNLWFMEFTGLDKRKAILINGFGKINIDSCHFENNRISISMYDYLGAGLVENNFIIHSEADGSAIIYDGTKEKVEFLSMNIGINNNFIKMDSGLFVRMNATHTPSSNYGINILLKRELMNRGNITLSNNKIENITTAIEVFNFGSSVIGGSQTDPSTGISISSNNLKSNTTGLYIYNPLQYWKIEQNSFDNIETDCEIKLFNPDNKIEFIETSNVLGRNANNNLNKFSDTKAKNSFKIFGNGVSVIGLELNSQVCLADGSNSIIRNNTINSNIYSHKPINRTDCDYKDFSTEVPKPELLSVNKNNNTLGINYSISDLDAMTADFAMDFYLTNGRGDLKNYLGSHTVNNNGTYLAEINIPSGIALLSGDSIAATVTSLGNVGTGLPAGTSEVVYLTLSGISDTLSFNCDDCIGSFSPVPGKKYVISAWVKEANAKPATTGYQNPVALIQFENHRGNIQKTEPFSAKGQIMDGWQRLEEEFVIPDQTMKIKLELSCKSGECYFDDVRIFPAEGTMKSFVYDPLTLRLMAELDERNYATFFEYDEEGELVRLKKETEKGIMTLQEYRKNLKLK